jgi:hypothetical protein
MLIVGYYEGDKLLFTASEKRACAEIAARRVYKLKHLETDVWPFPNLPDKKGRSG